MAKGIDSFNEADRELARRLYPGAVVQIVLFGVLLASTSLLAEHSLTAFAAGGVIFAANLMRFQLGLQRNRFAERVARWRGLYYAATITASAAWGALCVAVLFEYDLTSLATLYTFVIVCGTAAAGVSALSPWPFAARSFIVVLLLPPIAQLIFFVGPAGWPVAALTLVYFAFLFAQATVQGRSFADLHEATSHYRAIADNSGEGIFIHQEGKLVDVNSAGARMFGYDAKEMLGLPLTRIFDADNLALAYAQSLPHSGVVLNLEGKRADGSVFPVETCGIHCSWKGLPARAVRTRDLTETRRVSRILENAKEAAEAEVAIRTTELEESESRLAAMIEQSPLPTLILRPDGSLATINRAAKKLWAIEEGAEKFADAYNVRRDANWEEQGVLALVEDGWRGKASFLPSVFYDPSRVNSRAEPFWIEVFLAPVKRADGTVTALSLTLRDITRRRRAEAERAVLEIREKSALEASRLKSEFLANMSHEIRTPMNGVLGMVDILLATSLSQEQREYSETIRRSGEGLLTLINDILDFSKIEAGKLEFESTDFSLMEKVRDVERAFSVLVSGKDVLFTVEASPELPAVVRGDPVRFFQVVNNLVGNAVKFTHRGSVKLRVRPVGRVGGPPVIRVEVEDTGPGISPEARAKLFEPFSQADASTTRKFGGTGLGLSITKRLVERMQGRIGVESELGRGSLFWAEMALEESMAPNAAAARPVVDDSPLPPAHVLLAEDNIVNQKIAERMLERLGMRVTVADNGRQALTLLRSESFDLVFMDVQMPEMDGLEAARALRADPAARNAKIPIVALTANALKGDDQVCFDAGMSDYLTKPISADRLRVALRKWLAQGGGSGKPPAAA